MRCGYSRSGFEDVLKGTGFPSVLLAPLGGRAHKSFLIPCAVEREPSVHQKAGAAFTIRIAASQAADELWGAFVQMGVHLLASCGLSLSLCIHVYIHIYICVCE